MRTQHGKIKRSDLADSLWATEQRGTSICFPPQQKILAVGKWILFTANMGNSENIIFNQTEVILHQNNTPSWCFGASGWEK